MNETPRSRAFHWNIGGWFGGQLGASAWIAILGALYLAIDPLAGLAALGLFVAQNALGCWLWSRRIELAPYPAIQLLFGISLLAALAVLVLFDLRGHLGSLDPRLSARSMYLVLLVYPAVMLQFWWLERANR